MVPHETQGVDCFSGRCPGPRDVIARPSFGTVARCRRCGVVRVDPPRSAQAMADLHRTPEYFNHPYFAARRDISSAELTRKHRAMIEAMTADGRRQGASLLDIGCDTGSLLCVARDEFGMQVAGLEINERAAEVARSRHGLNVAVGTMEAAGLAPGSFDYITMIDLIEHVSDPVGLLKSAKRLLRPGGRIYIMTPNHDALIHLIGILLDKATGKLSRPLIDHLYIPWHEFYFDARTMAAAFRQAGLSMRSARSEEFPLDEFGHGIVLKAMLWPVFQVQWLVGRQSLLVAVAERTH